MMTRDSVLVPEEGEIDMYVCDLKFAIIAGILSTAVSPALSQVVDPNLQVRIETALPPPDIRPTLPTVVDVPVREIETYTTTETRSLSQAERLKRFYAKGMMLPADANRTPEAMNGILDANGIARTETVRVKRTRVRTKVVQKVEPRRTAVTAAFQSQSAFDTNALKTNLNRVSDWVFTNNASLTVSVPVGTLDNFVFQAGVADQRYARLSTKDLDLITSSVTYVQVLNATSAPNRPAAPGTTTVDALSYALASTTVFASGFSPYQVELFTPSITWARSNIDLGGTLCGPKDNIYCVSGTVAAGGEYTLSDIASQENFTVRLQGGATWQTPIAGLTATANGSLAARYYTAFPGGRQDLLLQAVARADYALTPTILLSGIIQVGQQFSTVRAYEWNGLTVFPVARLKIAF